MDIEQSLKGLENQLLDLTKKITEANNNKLAAEVRLNSEKDELNLLEDELRQLTGINSIDEIESYVSSKEVELSSILSDLSVLSNCINGENFTEQNVMDAKAIVQKYNIPITGDIK